MKRRDGNIWLIQSDHISGETLGVAIQQLFELGAMNVHVVPTITKKNRPGHILLMDVSDARSESGIEKYLFRELGILGYHVLSTRHICEVTKFIEQTVHVKCGNEKATFKILVKIIGERQSVSYPRVEHEHVVEVQREIQRRFGWEMPLRELVSEVESAAHGNRAEVTIELNSSRPDQTR